MRKWLKACFAKFCRKHQANDATIDALQERVGQLEEISLLILQDFFSFLHNKDDLELHKTSGHQTEEEKGLLKALYYKGNDTIH